MKHLTDKKPWQMTRKEFFKSGKEIPGHPHIAYVREALQEGKPIPPEVLKDYPDLARPMKHLTNPKREFNKEDIRFTREGDAVGREYHETIYAIDQKTNEIMGFVKHSYLQGESSVQMIEVKPEYKKKGIGLALLNELQSQSEKPITIMGDIATKEGQALWKKFKAQLTSAGGKEKEETPWNISLKDWNDIGANRRGYKGLPKGADAGDALEKDIKATGLPPGKRTHEDVKNWAIQKGHIEREKTDWEIRAEEKISENKKEFNTLIKQIPKQKLLGDNVVGDIYGIGKEGGDLTFKAKTTFKEMGYILDETPDLINDVPIEERELFVEFLKQNNRPVYDKIINLLRVNPEGKHLTFKHLD